MRGKHRFPCILAGLRPDANRAKRPVTTMAFRIGVLSPAAPFQEERADVRPRFERDVSTERTPDEKEASREGPENRHEKHRYETHEDVQRDTDS